MLPAGVAVQRGRQPADGQASTSIADLLGVRVTARNWRPKPSLPGWRSTISAATVRRWLAVDAPKPWQRRSWIFRCDPGFVAKATVVLDLYASDIGTGRVIGRCAPTTASARIIVELWFGPQSPYAGVHA